MACAISVLLRSSASSERMTLGGALDLRLRHDRPPPHPARSSARSWSGGPPSRSATGRGRPASPRPPPPRSSLPRARRRDRTPPVPRRSRPSTEVVCSQSGQRAAGAPPRTSRRRGGGRLGPIPPKSGERGLVDGAGALRAAEDEQRRALRREPEPAPALLPADRAPRAAPASRRPGTSRPFSPRPDRRGRRASQTAPRAGWRARSARPPPSARPECGAARPRTPSGRRRIHRRRARRRAGAAR